MEYRKNSQSEKAYAGAARDYETGVVFSFCDDVGWIHLQPNYGPPEGRVVRLTVGLLGRIYRDAMKAVKSKRPRNKKGAKQ